MSDTVFEMAYNEQGTAPVLARLRASRCAGPKRWKQAKRTRGQSREVCGLRSPPLAPVRACWSGD